MSGWRDSADNNELRLVVVILIFIGAAAFVLMPNRPAPVGPKPPEYRVNGDLGSKHVDELVRQYGGDFNKIPEDDRRWLDSLTAGHGAALIRSRAEEAAKKAAKAKGK